MFDHGKAHVNCGNEPGSMLFHERNGFFIKNAAVLNRCYPGSHRALNPFRAVRMGRDPTAPHRGFLDYGPHLFLRKLRRPEGFFLTENTGSRHELDEIRAKFDIPAYLFSNFRHTIHNAVKGVEAKVWREAVE